MIDAIENDADIQAVVSTGLLGTEPVRLALASLDRFCRGNDRPRNNNEDSCIEFAAYDVGPEVFTYIRVQCVSFYAWIDGCVDAER